MEETPVAVIEGNTLAEVLSVFYQNVPCKTRSDNCLQNCIYPQFPQ